MVDPRFTTFREDATHISVDQEMPVRKYDQNFADFTMDIMKQRLAKSKDVNITVNLGKKYFPKETLSSGPETQTAEDFIQKVPALAKVLYEKGLRKGDMVFIVIESRADIYLPVYATLMCQGTISVSLPSMSVRNLLMQIQETKAKFIFCTNQTYEKVIESGPRIINMDTDIEKLLLKGIQSKTVIPEQLTFDDDDVPVVLWTSGTTGLPKGIQLRSITLWEKYFGMLNDMNVLSTTSFSHFSGLTFAIFHINVSFSFIPSEDVAYYGVEKIFTAVKNEKYDSLILASSHVTSMAQKILDNKINEHENFKEIVSIIPVGDATYPNIEKDLRKVFKNLKHVPSFYGSTEAGGSLFMSYTQKSLGKLKPGGEVYVKDPHSDKRLGPNEPGELIFRYPKKVMKGYLNRPEENDKFFMKDGWCRIGDMVSFNENGEFFYQGRIKDMMKIQGNHVYPIEMEELIKNMHKKIIEVGVFTSEKNGTPVLGAVIVVNEDLEELTTEEIRNTVNKQVDDFKKLHGEIIFTKISLPRTYNGKVKRREIYSKYFF